MNDYKAFVERCFDELREALHSPRVIFLQWHMDSDGNLSIGTGCSAKIFSPNNPCELVVYNRSTRESKNSPISKEYVAGRILEGAALERYGFTQLTVKFDFGNVMIECPKYIVVCVICSLTSTKNISFSYFTSVGNKRPYVTVLVDGEPAGIIGGWYK